jgi:hypothetical protein
MKMRPHQIGETPTFIQQNSQPKIYTSTLSSLMPGPSLGPNILELNKNFLGMGQTAKSCRKMSCFAPVQNVLVVSKKN